MRIYTTHTMPNRAPVLVREGFAWGAFVLGPLWLLAHRAWGPGVLGLCAWLLIPAFAAPAAGVPAMVALHWAFGLFGQDLRRWSLAQAGYTLVHVVAAADQDAALARLLDRRPDLIPGALA
jgi:hypothetical protein